MVNRGTKGHRVTQQLYLSEYAATRLPQAALSMDTAEALYRRYGAQISVEFPSFKTDYAWELTPQGWVGQIPITPDLTLILVPKTPIGNLFRMLEYAYHLKSFQFLDGLVATDALEDLYERLAGILAKRVLDRARRGLYRAYVGREERLSHLSGRMNLRQMIQRPWAVDLPCRYEEHTADIDDNQILAWTLGVILRAGVCTERTQSTVRKAYRTLQTATGPAQFSPQDCVRRLYNRLNEDYQPMHALSRFFLEHAGPSHKVGDRTMVPFLVNMARLYELFVAEWLQQHLPEHLALRSQEQVWLNEANSLHADIDLTLTDLRTGRTLCVLDTKYKVPEAAATSDFYQAVTYAKLKDTETAFLVYPAPLAAPLNGSAGEIRVRSCTFPIDGDLETAGQAFLSSLLRIVEAQPSEYSGSAAE
jgi:5-methylcytosine-specific restriction enzyme subunit McrC